MEEKLNLLDLEFRVYDSGSLPPYFKYEETDQELANFYNEDAERLQKESITRVMNVFFEDRLIAYFAYATSEIKAQDLLPEDKIAPFSHPSIKLGRLLVCSSMKRRGVGTAILQYLAKQALDIRDKIALRFLLVDSVPNAVEFYKSKGFIETGIKRGSNRDLSLLYIDLNLVIETLG